MSLTPGQVVDLFNKKGAIFCTEVNKLIKKWAGIKAIILDWDGVFNDGSKKSNQESGFSEIDSMGINLLRFALFLKNGKLPFASILTGMNNESAIKFANREHFDFCYFGFKNKEIPFQHFCKENSIKAEEVLFWFDDVLDFPIAKTSGIRINIPHPGSFLLNKYIIDNHFADVITSNIGGQGAIRESCEMLLGVNGVYEKVIESRSAFDSDYSSYYFSRQKMKTQFFESDLESQPIRTSDLSL
jgi:3-deoxy-D-manno-octulosonate 8-phosphate phosphatase (KDO 8-P phosphatase)